MYPDIANEVNTAARYFICTISNEVNIAGNSKSIASKEKPGSNKKVTQHGQQVTEV